MAEGEIAISELDSVSTVTNIDKIYINQSGVDSTANVQQVQNLILSNLDSALLGATMPIDALVCIKGGVVGSITPYLIQAELLPKKYIFTIDASNLEIDCGTLEKDITELVIKIDAKNLPVTSSYGNVYNIINSNIKKVYIEKEENKNFYAPFTFMPGDSRYSSLKYIAVSLGEKSNTIDKVNVFRFNGFTQSAFKSNGQDYNLTDIEIPCYRRTYCDYLEIANEAGNKKVCTYYSIQGFATIIDSWTAITQNTEIDFASWIFLFGKDRGFLTYSNDNFTITNAGTTSVFEVATHAHKCQVWAKQGYSSSVLANLNMECFTFATKRLIGGETPKNTIGILGYNFSTSKKTPYFVMDQTGKTVTVNNPIKMKFNSKISFMNVTVGVTASAVRSIPVAWVLVNIDYFQR